MNEGKKKLAEEVQRFLSVIYSDLSSHYHLIRDEVLGELLLYRYGHMCFSDWNCVFCAAAEFISKRYGEDPASFYNYAKLAEGAMNGTKVNTVDPQLVVEEVPAVKKCRKLARLIYGIDEQFGYVVSFKEARSFLRAAKDGRVSALSETKVLTAEEVIRISKTSVKKSTIEGNQRRRKEAILE